MLRSYLVLTVWYAWLEATGSVLWWDVTDFGPSLLVVDRPLVAIRPRRDVGRHGRVLRAKSLVKVLRRRQHPGPLVMAHWLATFVA